MNWEAIGAVGDAVGALVVVITLVYLTIQLRQNTKAIEHSTSRGVSDDAAQWMYKLIENPRVAEIYLAGLRGDEQSSRDHFRFGLLMGLFFNNSNHALQAGAYDFYNNSTMAAILSKPGGAAFWKRTLANNTATLSPEFIDLVNKLLAEVGSGSSQESKSA